MDRNTLIAIALSLLLIVGFYVIFPPKQTKPPVSKNEVKKTQTEKKPEPIKQDKQTSVNNVKPAEMYDPTIDQGKELIKHFKLTTAKYHVYFNTVDASVTNLKLKDYKDQYGLLIDSVFFEPLKVRIKKIPADFLKKENEVVIPKPFNEIMRFDQSNGDIHLLYNGVLSTDEKNHLQRLSSDPDYRKALEELFIQSQKILLNRMYPLATSFQQASQLKNKTKMVFQYATYQYISDKKQLKLINEGTLKNNASEYNENILKNIDKLIKRYDYGKNKELKELKIALFVADFEIPDTNRKFRMIKIFTFHENDYLFDLDTQVKKLSQDSFTIRSNDSGSSRASFYIHWGNHMGPYYSPKNKTTYDEHLEIAYLEVQSQNSTKEHTIEESKSQFTNFKWLAMDSRYIVTYLITDWEINSQKQKSWTKPGEYFGEVHTGKEIKEKQEEVIGIGYRPIDLEKKDQDSFHLSIYTGPKTRSILNQDHYEPFELITIRNRSWMSFIKPLEWAIEWLLFTSNKLVYNFGIAIIILTIILKILLHPLTKKSMDSTRKLQELQPKLKELDVKYKKNPQQKQKALMELYKKEGVNPLGGCLPILLQLPFFYALWNVMPVLLDLKNANFLWIKDLSSPDTVVNDLNLAVTTVNLNILPIIMTVTSILQMKFSPQTAPNMGGDDKAQMAKMMQYMMPAIFLFIFWNMPSGLVLYWTVQNILQIGHQLITNYLSKRKSSKIK